MKKLKPLLIGLSAASINIIPTATQIIKPERCTGACGTCGFYCVGSVVSITLIGFIILGFKKLRTKFNSSISAIRRKN